MGIIDEYKKNYGAEDRRVNRRLMLVGTGMFLGIVAYGGGQELAEHFDRRWVGWVTAFIAGLTGFGLAASRWFDPPSPDRTD